MIHSRIEHEMHYAALLQSMPQLLECLAPIAEDFVTLINAISSPIESDAELEERMALIDELYSYAETETDVSAVFASKVADRVYEYEHEHLELPEVTPSEALSYFIKERGLKQSDLSEIAPQSVISELVNGKRTMTVDQIKGFANFFNVPEKTFL